MADWTWVPPASTGYQEEGTGLLPFGRYRMPDGSQQVSFGLPQGLLDAYRGMRQGLGFEQDPQAPQGYVSQNAMIKAAFGGAGGAMTGTVGANAMRVAMRGKNAMASRALIANSDSDISGAAQALFRKGVLSDERRSLPLDKQLEIFMFTPANRTYADEAANLLRAYRERNAADTPSSEALPQSAMTAQSAPSHRVSSDATYYHGTRSGISDPKQLRPATEFRDAPSAIFVTPDSDYARFHANGMSGSKGNPSVIPMKLDPENFADVSNADHIRRIAEQYAKASGMPVDQAAQFVSSRIRNGQLAWTENEIIKAIQNAGFDGVPLSDAFGPSVAIFNGGAIRENGKLR